LESSLRALEEERDAWRNRSNQIQEMMDANNLESQQRIEALERALEDTAGDTGARFQELEGQIVYARAELENATNRIRDLESEKEALNAETMNRSTDLESALQAAAAEREDLEDQISRLHREIEVAEEDRTDSQGRIARLEQALKLAEADKEELQAVIADLERTVEENNAEREQLEEKISNLESNLRVLKMESDAAAEEAQQALALAREEADRAIYELRMEHENRAAQDGAHSQANEGEWMSRLEETRLDAESKVEWAKQEVEAARERELQALDKIREAEDTLEEAMRVRDEALSQLENLQMDMDSSRQEVDQLRMQLQNASERSRGVGGDDDDSSDQYDRIIELETELARAREQLELAQSSNMSSSGDEDLVSLRRTIRIYEWLDKVILTFVR
jgi:chromosome segregation ATPase